MASSLVLGVLSFLSESCWPSISSSYGFYIGILEKMDLVLPLFVLFYCCRFCDVLVIEIQSNLTYYVVLSCDVNGLTCFLFLLLRNSLFYSNSYYNFTCWMSQESREISLTQLGTFTKPVVLKCKEVILFIKQYHPIGFFFVSFMLSIDIIRVHREVSGVALQFYSYIWIKINLLISSFPLFCLLLWFVSCFLIILLIIA